MRSIQLLEGPDPIQADDWCRPLVLISMSDGMSDSYSFKSCYSGTPENNVKWVRVKHTLGECWYGQTVAAVNKALERCPLEFIRGDIPSAHQLNMHGYTRITD